MTQKQKLLFAGIIFSAFFFRFYQITWLPGGLFPDEAANGLDINLMQQGQLQPFYERGNGREALFFYMLWGSVELFGKGPWQHHIVSALVGVLAVILCFLLTRKLFSIENASDMQEDRFNRATNIALLAAFLMAVSTWHTVLSRTAFRANLIPLFTSLTIYFILCTYQSSISSSTALLFQTEKIKKFNCKKYLYSFLAGASFALGFYTYIAYRILVPILVILILWPWIASGFIIQIKRYWKAFLLFLLAFFIFFYPLGKYFYTHPGSFVGRSGQVSVFNPDLNQGNLAGAVWEVTKQSLLAYFTQGDVNWRHNISGFPFLSQLVSPFFGVALVIVTLLAVWYIFTPRTPPPSPSFKGGDKRGWWTYALLAGWFWGMLLPVITTAEGIPHGLRAIGTIPSVFIISALGLYWLGEITIKLHKKISDVNLMIKNLKIVKFVLKVVVACFAIALILQTYFMYFVYAANSPENYYAFRSDLTLVSQYLVSRCLKEKTYLILDKFSVQTPDYITMIDGHNLKNLCNQPYKQIDPEDAWKLANLKVEDEIIFTQSTIFDIKKFKQYHPEAHLVLEYRNKFGQAIMAVYRINN